MVWVRVYQIRLEVSSLWLRVGASASAGHEGGAGVSVVHGAAGTRTHLACMLT